jgi:hypothetical protein
MRSTIKTIILAVAGAAVIVATPALAKSKRAAVDQFSAPAITQLNQEGAFAPWQGGNDAFGQIRSEYLKDAPTHNGNAY